jgi:hypothetical protein
MPWKKLQLYWNSRKKIIFTLLSILKLHDEINALSSVTGVKKNHSFGIIYKF